jgi:thioredoxin-related protein
MKNGLLLFSFLSLYNVNWHHNLVEARQAAKTEHKLILLNFSGSDWCGPCIRMHKEIFENTSFIHLADTALVLVNADFPRLKKNQPSKNQEIENEKMADAYNPSGIFPFTVLLDENGKKLREWEGYPNESPGEFIKDLNNAIKQYK